MIFRIFLRSDIPGESCEKWRYYEKNCYRYMQQNYIRNRFQDSKKQTDLVYNIRCIIIYQEAVK